MTDVKAELQSDLDEQVAICKALMDAIPQNVRYTNLVLALRSLVDAITSEEGLDILFADDRSAADGRKRGER